MICLSGPKYENFLWALDIFSMPFQCLFNILEGQMICDKDFSMVPQCFLLINLDLKHPNFFMDPGYFSIVFQDLVNVFYARVSRFFQCDVHRVGLDLDDTRSSFNRFSTVFYLFYGFQSFLWRGFFNAFQSF
jgi:hypothetical protein